MVKWIKEEMNLSKEEIGREKFLAYAWEWTNKYGGTITQQLKLSVMTYFVNGTAMKGHTLSKTVDSHEENGKINLRSQSFVVLKESKVKALTLSDQFPP